jgi:hypothetical protein
MQKGRCALGSLPLLLSSALSVLAREVPASDQGPFPVAITLDPLTHAFLLIDPDPESATSVNDTLVNPLGIERVANVGPSVFIVSSPFGFDLDHDGAREFVTRLDVGGDLNETTFEVYESTGNDSFALAHTIALPGSHDSYYPFDAGDVDRDGLSDLTVSGRTLNDFHLRLYESPTSNSYPSQVVWDQPVTWWQVGAKIADTDLDGRKEIVSAGQDGDEFMNRVAIYEYDGADNSFRQSFYGPTPTMATSQAMDVVNDLDGDGWPEIVYGGLTPGGAGEVHIFEAVADDTYHEAWSSAVTYQGDAMNASRIRSVGDLDGDGHGEFVVAGLQGGPPFIAVLLVFEADADDAFGVVAAMAIPMGAIDDLGLVIADVDADGKKEIVLGVGKQVHVFRNTRDNAWNEVWQGAASIKNSVGAGDHDGDGAEEIIFRRSWNSTEIAEGIKVDSDSDGVSNALDNCAYAPNPAQGPAVLGQTLLAMGPNAFGWSSPAPVAYVRGPLESVGTYAYDLFETLPLGQTLADATLPNAGAGLYYLVKPDCAMGSWQSSPGAEPGRDDVLP